MKNQDLLSTGDLSKLLGVTLSAQFIRDLKEVQPHCVIAPGVYWRKEDAPAIGMAAAVWLFRRSADLQLKSP